MVEMVEKYLPLNCYIMLLGSKISQFEKLTTAVEKIFGWYRTSVEL